MKNTNSSYVFRACRCAPPRNPALTCAREQAEVCRENPYARLYVVSQTYENFAGACNALKNGTIFNDLYMPYVPESCKSAAPCNCNATGGDKK